MSSLILPYPISLNRYWRNFRGRQVVSVEARAYKASAAWTAAKVGLKPLAGKVALAITLHPKKPKRATGKDARCMDLDNAMKIAIDALNGVAYGDDSQIVSLHILRGDPVPEGQLTVKVSPCSP